MLYDEVYTPKSEDAIISTKIEQRNIKLFLFRCFCGMRVCDMNLSNISKESLKRDSTTFTYFQDKGVKATSVSCIGSYLYDIAESINWDFPEFKTPNSLRSYGRRETAALRKYLAHILKDNQRKIRHITEKDFVFTLLSDEVTTHTARKTFAHLLYDLTKDIMLVKKQLGHTQIEITMKYLDFNISGESGDLKYLNLGF